MKSASIGEWVVYLTTVLCFIICLYNHYDYYAIILLLFLSILPITIEFLEEDKENNYASTRD